METAFRFSENYVSSKSPAIILMITKNITLASTVTLSKTYFIKVSVQYINRSFMSALDCSTQRKVTVKPRLIIETVRYLKLTILHRIGY